MKTRFIQKKSWSVSVLLQESKLCFFIEAFSKQTRIVNYTILKGFSRKVQRIVLVVLPLCTVILLYFKHSPFSMPIQAIKSPCWNWFHFMIYNFGWFWTLLADIHTGLLSTQQNSQEYKLTTAQGDNINMA